jgi:lysophospholipase L1-like esterase
MSAVRRSILYAATLLVPVLALAAMELSLRALWPGGANPVFSAVRGDSTLLTPDRLVARRYFAGEAAPPAPSTDVFAAHKPANGFRLFVLGESTAAGFPYPHNGTFSRVLRDALRDVLPADSVEVVNLGIAATNSYTVADLASAVVDQQPDAVLIYVGHNEYYGALGVGSSLGGGLSRALTRAYLAAERLRLFTVVRDAGAALRTRSASHAPQDSTVATFMETIARDQDIRIGSDTYAAGLKQFSDNISTALRFFADRHIPVFIASVESNLRSQHPFASPSNREADSAFTTGQGALALGDTASGARLLRRARDLDVVRFRAPMALDDSVRRLAAAGGAIYVPVAERFDSLSPGGLPGPELFLEHVHPNARGYAEMGRVFFEAIQSRGFLGRHAQLARFAGWDAYRARMALTPLDDRIVEHTVRTVTTRWPFVSRARAADYRGTYVPVDGPDSLAFLVSRGGMAWGEAKGRLGQRYERTGHPDSALAEYRGLLRDAPYRELPNRLVGRMLFAMGRPEEALPLVERAMRLRPSGEAAYLLGSIHLARHELEPAIAFLDEAVRLAPADPAPAYRLSVAFGLSHNLAAARAAASRAAALDPRHPGLAAWMGVLGMRPP